MGVWSIGIGFSLVPHAYPAFFAVTVLLFSLGLRPHEVADRNLAMTFPAAVAWAACLLQV